MRRRPRRKVTLAAAVDSPVSVPASIPKPPDLYRSLIAVVSWAAPVSLILIVVVLFQQAWPSVVRFGLGFFLGTEWNPVTNTFGALPFILGTLLTSAIAIAIALPVGVAVAILLAEPGPPGPRGGLGPGVELLAAIPPVVYGIWARWVLAPWGLFHADSPHPDRPTPLQLFGA